MTAPAPDPRTPTDRPPGGRAAGRGSAVPDPAAGGRAAGRGPAVPDPAAGGQAAGRGPAVPDPAAADRAGPVTDAGLREHYATHHDEAKRLTSTLRGRLERTRVREVLARYLPAPPAEVADIGGGTGVHAGWLRGRGYRVRLLDAVPRHVDAARSTGIAAVLGDARELPWPDDSVDLAFLAGPLYHLVDPDDRIVALAEAGRVVRPGGRVAVVALSRHANLIGATLAGQLEQRRLIVEEIETSGTSRRNDRMAAATYYHVVDELRGELAAAGLRDVTVHGVTGPGGWLAVVLDRHFGGACPDTIADADPLITAVRAARLADRHADLVAASALLMAVGRTPRVRR